jgi:putative peptidoglycan lipid II flippase
MAAALWFAMGPAEWWFAAGWKLRLPALGGLVVLGISIYAGSLLALGFRPREFSRRGAG